MPVPFFTETQSYTQLKELAIEMANTSPEAVFDSADRFAQYSCEASGILLDCSKNMLSHQVTQALFQLAQERQVQEQVKDWLGGKAINTSEDRPALHTLLRASKESQWAQHKDYPQVVEQTQAMLSLQERLDSGALKGCTGKPITTVVNIGIGGSAMGVKAAYHGLGGHDRLRDCRFIVNIDPANAHHQLAGLDLESAIVLVSSKSFTTLETLTNYRHVKSILADKHSAEKADQHFYAITASPEKAQDNGFDASRIVVFPEWVGGRFSVWSAVGLPVLLCYGKEVWQQFLAGAESLDVHLAESQPSQNIPLLMALIAVWQGSFLSINNHAVLCYSHDLRYLTEHLQQLVMESNGKSVLSNGEAVDFATGEIVWGGENSNGQHSYFQWLHQASSISSTDFIVPATTGYQRQQTHNQLVAMALGQSRALFFGDAQESQHAHTHGARQSNTLIIEQLNARTLGALIALYEHKTVLMAMIWGINPFDQWGVEAGKKSASSLYPYFQDTGKDTNDLDVSTAGLVQAIRDRQKS